jgi:ribosomal protein S27E
MTDQQRREKQIERYMCRCIHFNGISNETCKAGVNYDGLRGTQVGALPCWSDTETPLVCDKRLLPTREQAEAHENEVAERQAATMKALRATHDDAKAKGLEKGNGGRSSVKCPTCGNGEIHYSVASYNGHIHASCSTQGCVSWME